MSRFLRHATFCLALACVLSCWARPLWAAPRDVRLLSTQIEPAPPGASLDLAQVARRLEAVLGDALLDCDALSLQAGYLVRIVRQQPDTVHAQRPEHRRRKPIVALVVGESKALVGVDRVQPAILQRIGAQFIGQPDAAPFLPKVEKDATAFVTEDSQGFAELGAAVALEAAEHVTGQAFAVKPH